MPANGYVYETFGISKHFPVKLQVPLMRAKTLYNRLSRQFFIPRVELDSPSRIAFLKVPDSFCNSKLLTTKISDYEKEIGKLPEKMDPEEINEYLVALARDPKSPSRSSFKQMVYGLRYYYRLPGMNKNAIALPSLKKDSKLPVILNRHELKELFAAPNLLKQPIVRALIYSAGLRGQEVINLKISDIDFQRKTIHIRESKYKKDRIVPLAQSMAQSAIYCVLPFIFL